MHLNVDALLTVSAIIFVVTMGGLAAVEIGMRRDLRAFERERERLRR